MARRSHERTPRIFLCSPILLALGALAGCAGDDAAGFAQPRDATFACGPTRIEARFMERRMALFIDGKAYALRQDVSGSGARYIGRDGSAPIEFWTKGDEATLTFGTREFPPCQAEAKK